MLTVLLLQSRIIASNANDAAKSFFLFAHRFKIFDKGTTRSVPCWDALEYWDLGQCLEITFIRANRRQSYLSEQISLIVCAFAIFASHSSLVDSDVSGAAANTL